MDVFILKKEDYQIVGFNCKALFGFAFVLGYCWEILDVCYQGWLSQEKFLKPLWAQGEYLHFFKGFFFFFVIRWFHIPHSILNIANDCCNASLQHPSPTERLPPIRYALSENQMNYDNMTGYRNFWKSIVLQDIFLASTKIWLALAARKLGGPALWCTLVAAILVAALNIRNLYLYMWTVLAFDLELTDMLDEIGIEEDKKCFDVQNIRKNLSLEWLRDRYRARGLAVIQADDLSVISQDTA